MGCAGTRGGSWLLLRQAPVQQNSARLSTQSSTRRRPLGRKHDPAKDLSVAELAEAARRQVLNDLELLDERAAATAFGGADHSDAQAALTNAGELIALPVDGTRLYPTFQLLKATNADRFSLITAVNRLLHAGRHPWSAASWWSTPNTSVGGHPHPVDLIDHQPAPVLELATAHANGPDL